METSPAELNMLADFQLVGLQKFENSDCHDCKRWIFLLPDIF